MYNFTLLMSRHDVKKQLIDPIIQFKKLIYLATIFNLDLLFYILSCLCSFFIEQDKKGNLYMNNYML